MTGSTATRMFYGMSNGNVSDFGGDATQFVDGVYRKTSTFISDLSSIKAQGARVMMKFPGNSANQQDSNSNFSLAMWKSNMDACFNVNGSGAAARLATAQQIAAFVADGTLMCNYMLDDFKIGSNVFNVVPTYAEIEACAAYSKSVWTTLPCQARAEGQYWKTLADGASKTSYLSLDYGWTQWHHRFGDPQAWYSNSLRDAKAYGMGMICGINFLGGGSGITAPWNIPLASGNDRNNGMSPQEIDACTAALSALTMHLGTNVWSLDFDETRDYRHFDSIETALDRHANAMIGKQAGPINWHSGASLDWFPPGSGFADPRASGSSETQPTGPAPAGWGYTAGSTFKTGGAASQPVTLPSVVFTGDMLCIVGYSRDADQRYMGTISGWSTAFSISGNSLRGGALSLQYKIATGSEGGASVSVPWITPGTRDTTGASCMVRAFKFSGNTTQIGTLLNRTGSLTTWAQGSSNMGPVKGGITSTVSDCMVMILAAKVKGVGATTPPQGTFSGTTVKTGEVWFRAFQDYNGTGDDSFMFMDYAFLSGKPSVETKSWSQLTNVNSNTSGSGCGVMLMFAPTSFISGIPPAITELVDVTFSLSSTLSFTMASTGSTPITFSKNSAPSNMTLNSSTGVVSWTPLSAGTYFIILQATNSFGSDLESFTATVVSSSVATPNTAPVITHPGDQSVAIGDSLSLQVMATDAEGDPISYQMETSLSGMALGSSTGAFTWTPEASQAPQDFAVVISAFDGQATSYSTFTIHVTNDPGLGTGNTWTRTDPNSGNRFTRFRY